MKKAFFSFAVLAFVAIGLFFFASLAFGARDYRESAVTNLEARNVFQRTQDAQLYASAALDDAILDTAFRIYNCSISVPNVNPPSNKSIAFCIDFNTSANSLSRPYLYAIRNLSGDGITVTNQSTSIKCDPNVQDNDPSLLPYNFSLNVTMNVTVLVNSSHATSRQTFRYAKRVDIAFPNMTLGTGWSDAIGQFRLFINDTGYLNASRVGRNYTWHVNCSA